MRGCCLRNVNKQIKDKMKKKRWLKKIKKEIEVGNNQKRPKKISGNKQSRRTRRLMGLKSEVVTVTEWTREYNGYIDFLKLD